ncbi:MAG: NAD(P)H-hydrate dehydratase, partial [Pseudobdellovibrionaceae bacterium]
EQSKELDQKTSENYDLSSEILMESAGSLLSAQIENLYFSELGKGSIVIVCGPGHNGADGFVVARHLAARGYKDISVFTWGQGLELWSKQKNRVLAHQVSVYEAILNIELFESLIRKSNLLIDSFFGVGLSRNLNGESEKIVNLMNQTTSPIVAIDVPSGLNSGTGRVQGVCVKADSTLSVGFNKPGFFICEGPKHVGRLHLIPLSYPKELVQKIAKTHFAFDQKLASRTLPRRPDFSHKGSYGRCLIVGGSAGMKGAPLLASFAAARVGCGYVTIASLDSDLATWKEAPEFLTLENAEKKSNWPRFEERRYQSICVGPGLGRGEKSREWIQHLKNENFQNVVLDADALHFAKDFFPLPSTWLLTPHVGEASKLYEFSAEEIESDRCKAAIEISKKAGCPVLLKGFRTVIAFNGKCSIVLSGNSALAKAGSGDVLSEMIAGLAAQDMTLLESAAVAAFVHGKCADRWSRDGNDKASLVPSDLLNSIPSILSEVRGDKF